MKLLESDVYIFSQVPSNMVLWIYHCTVYHQRMKRILLVQALQASQVFKVILHYFYDLILHATCKEHMKIRVSPNSKVHVHA